MKIKREALIRYERRERRVADQWGLYTEVRKITTFRELREHSILGGCIKWWTLLKEYEVVGKWF